MNCNCNNKNNALTPPKVRLVQGNLLRLALPLTLRTVDVVDGNVEVNDEPFYPSSDYPVKVILSKGANKAIYDATMQGNIAYIEDKGKLPVGTYEITVTCSDDNGNPYRFNEIGVVQVFHSTAEAGITSPIEYEVQTWYLDAAIYLALKGEDGVGIEDIETTSSGEIGGMNTVTFILTDGRTKTFTVMNGSGSVDQLLDENSLHPIANKVVTARFNELADELAGLFGDVDYDTQSKSIRFWDKGKTNVLASLDARPFIKDGMVNSVYISNNTLVITFNTDSGREAIGVPLSSVFNPNNYYTKTQVDNRIASVLSGYYTKAQVDDALADVSKVKSVTVNGHTYEPDQTTGDIDLGNISVQDGKVDIKTYQTYQSMVNAASHGGIANGTIGFDQDKEVFYIFSSTNAEWIRLGKEPLFKQYASKSAMDADTDVVTGLIGFDGYEEVFYIYDSANNEWCRIDDVQADWNETDTNSPAFIKNKPTIPDVSGFATTDDVDNAVAALVSSAPATLDTLKELADALGDDPNFATTMATQLGNKADKATTYTKSEVDGLVSDAGKVKSITVNGQKKLPNEQTGDVDLGTIEGGGTAASGFTVTETATSLVLTVWDGATVKETSTSITIQQS